MSLALVAFVAPGSAGACPDCPTQVEARSELVEEEPGKWLVVSLAPFVAIALLATVSYRVGRPRPHR